MAFVLDCFIALPWVLPDEVNASANDIADRMEREAVYVPPTWSLEVGNALLIAKRRGRIKASDLGRLVGASPGCRSRSSTTQAPQRLRGISPGSLD